MWFYSFVLKNVQKFGLFYWVCENKYNFNFFVFCPTFVILSMSVKKHAEISTFCCFLQKQFNFSLIWNLKLHFFVQRWWKVFPSPLGPPSLLELLESLPCLPLPERNPLYLFTSFFPIQFFSRTGYFISPLFLNWYSHRVDSSSPFSSIYFYLTIVLSPTSHC